MESLPVFMRETYIIKPDSRIPMKDIYEDFRAWVIGKQGAPAWNNVRQKQVYAVLKELPSYAYVRYREGYCLKGIAYKAKEELPKLMTLNVIEPVKEEITIKQRPVFDAPPRITQIIVPRAFQNSS